MNRETASSLARQARQLIRSKRYREAFQLAAQARDQNPRCAQVNIFLIKKEIQYHTVSIAILLVVGLVFYLT